LSSVGGAERLEQPILVGDVRLERSIEDAEPFWCEPDDRSPSIAWVRPAGEEAHQFEVVESLGGSPRGEHRGPHEFGGGELVGRTGAPQRGQQVEPPRSEAVGGGSVGELAVREVREAKQPAECRQRGDVQVGSFAAPLRRDLVEAVGFSSRQESSM